VLNDYENRKALGRRQDVYNYGYGTYQK
jgi:hypothetical protein